jgi:hypothetical protein
MKLSRSVRALALCVALWAIHSDRALAQGGSGSHRSFASEVQAALSACNLKADSEQLANYDKDHWVDRSLKGSARKARIEEINAWDAAHPLVDTCRNRLAKVNASLEDDGMFGMMSPVARNSVGYGYAVHMYTYKHTVPQFVEAINSQLGNNRLGPSQSKKIEARILSNPAFAKLNCAQAGDETTSYTELNNSCDTRQLAIRDQFSFAIALECAKGLSGNELESGNGLDRLMSCMESRVGLSSLSSPLSHG